MDYRQPCTTHALRRFLGLVNFYHRFVPHCADIIQPLHLLLASHPAKPKHAPLTWNDSSLLAFQAIKTALSNATLLTHPAPSAELCLMTDASQTGIGGVLQQQVNDDWQPIAFFSRKLDDTQRRYSTLLNAATARYSTPLQHVTQRRYSTLLNAATARYSTPLQHVTQRRYSTLLNAATARYSTPVQHVTQRRYSTLLNAATARYSTPLQHVTQRRYSTLLNAATARYSTPLQHVTQRRYSTLLNAATARYSTPLQHVTQRRYSTLLNAGTARYSTPLQHVRSRTTGSAFSCQALPAIPGGS